MTKFIYAFVLMFAFSCLNASAQEGKRDGNKNRKFDRTEMLKKRTDRMVERYGLDEKQAKELLELNTEFDGKMGRNGMRPQMRNGRNGNGQNVDGDKAAERPSKEQVEAMMKEMKKNREEYNESLKKIMTSEQYAKYEQEQKEMLKNRNNTNLRNRSKKTSE